MCRGIRIRRNKMGVPFGSTPMFGTSGPSDRYNPGSSGPVGGTPMFGGFDTGAGLGQNSNQFFNPLPPSPSLSGPGVVPTGSAGSAPPGAGIQTQTNPAGGDLQIINPLDPSL